MSETPEIKTSKAFQETQTAIHSVVAQMLQDQKPLDGNAERFMREVEEKNLTIERLTKLRSEIISEYRNQLHKIALEDLTTIGELSNIIFDKTSPTRVQCQYEGTKLTLTYNDLFQIMTIDFGGVLITIDHGTENRIDGFMLKKISQLLLHTQKNTTDVKAARYNGFYLESDVIIDDTTQSVLSNGMDIYILVSKASTSLMRKWQLLEIKKEQLASKSDAGSVEELEKLSQECDVLEKEVNTVVLKTIPDSDQNATLVQETSIMGTISNPKWEHRNHQGMLQKVIDMPKTGYRVKKYDNNEVVVVENYTHTLVKESVQYLDTGTTELYESDKPIILIDENPSSSSPRIVISKTRSISSYVREREKDETMTFKTYLATLQSVINNPKRVNYFLENCMTYIKDSKKDLYQIQTTEETFLRGMKGDCDEYAEIGCTLLRAHGYAAYSISVEAEEGPHATCLYWKKLDSGKWEIGRLCTYPPHSLISDTFEDGVKEVLEKSHFKSVLPSTGQIFINFPSSEKRRKTDVPLAALQDHPEYAMDYSLAMSENGSQKKFTALQTLNKKYPKEPQIAFELAYHSRILGRDDAKDLFRKLLELGQSPGDEMMEYLMKGFLEDSKMSPEELKGFFKKIMPVTLERNLPLLKKEGLSDKKRQYIVKGLIFILHNAGYDEIEINRIIEVK